PAAGAILCRAARRERWRELERDLQSWEEWAAELMETHLSYPILGYYRSQHVNQNWLAALTAMVDVAAFVTAVEADGESEAAEITFGIGRHALAQRLGGAAVGHLFRPRPAHVRDRALDRPDHIRDRDLLGRLGEPVATFGSALALDEPGVLQVEQDVLEEFERDVLRLRDPFAL